MRVVLPLALLLAATACSRSREEPPDASAVTSSPGAEAASPGEVRIITTSGQLDLALIGDSISSGLSPSSLAETRRGADTGMVTGSGLAATIERAVKGAVGGALNTRMSFALSDINDVRYEAGALKFDWRNERTRLFDNTSINGRPFLESFSPADAERFVQAVRARKRAGRGAT